MKGNIIRIKLKAFEHKTVDKATEEIVRAAKKARAEISGPIPLPTQIRRYTVLRSPHVHITSREQFEMRIHKRMIDIINPNQEVINVLSKLELPEGVNVEIKQI
ncbi:MAG: 30S ribosomal protein S10 [Spirochaetes bacterium]|nr:30S ribosomal protein S10 [Spirochaetota bacterium]